MYFYLESFSKKTIKRKRKRKGIIKEHKARVQEYNQVTRKPARQITEAKYIRRVLEFKLVRGQERLKKAQSIKLWRLLANRNRDDIWLNLENKFYEILHLLWKMYMRTTFQSVRYSGINAHHWLKQTCDVVPPRQEQENAQCMKQIESRPLITR